MSKKKISQKEKLLNVELFVRTLEERITELENRLKNTNIALSNVSRDLARVEQLTDETEATVMEIVRKNEFIEERNNIINYLISTDFKGSVRHKRLIFKMKKELKEALNYNSFEELKREILNGERNLEDLRKYRDILLKHEEEQKIVDYVNREE